MPHHRPFPRICIALGLPDAARLLEHARQEAESGETFLEFRLDHLDQPENGIKVIREFLKAHSGCIVLATCRRHQNHGKFNGSIEEQLRILELAVGAGAQAIDIEIETAEAALREARRVPRPRPGHRLLSQLRSHAAHGHGGEPHDADSPPTPTRSSPRRASLPTTCACWRSPKRCPSTPIVVWPWANWGFPRACSRRSSAASTPMPRRMCAEGTAAGQVSAHLLRHLYRVEKSAKLAQRSTA